jgi:two-component system sensor histidine kinase YesM
MKQKLISLFLLASIVPIAILSIFFYRNTSDILIRRTYEEVQTSNEQMTTNLGNQLEIFEHMTSRLYTDTVLKSYLVKTYESDYDFVTAYQYIDQLLYGMLAANSNVYGVRLCVPNNTIPSDGKFIHHIDEHEQAPAFLTDESVSYGNILYDGAKMDDKGTSVFSVGRVLNYNNQNYPYAYLAVSVEESVLYSLFESEANKKSIYVVDAKNIIVSTKDKSLLSRQLESVISSDALPYIEESSIDPKIAILDGKEAIIVSNQMHNGWKVVTTVELSEMTGEIQSRSFQIILLVIFCSSFSLILVFVISRYFSNRIQLLVQQIQRVENSDFAYQEEFVGGDELGSLSASINKMAGKLNEAINEVYIKDIERKQSQLNLLQSQINPHFLYNTLSGIATLALHNDDEEVNLFINHLSQFYKTSLHQGKDRIKIEEEVEITKHYIALQNMRFRDLLSVKWSIDETLLDRMTVKLILQPFIENIVNHAPHRNERQLDVTIAIQRVDNDILFTIQDNGVGIQEEKLRFLLSDQSSGYGILNTNARIQLFYGNSYGVMIQSVLGKGTKVTVRIPGST